MRNNLQSYRAADTLGKSQLDLILQVYDGALKSFTCARAHYEKEEFNPGYEELEKAKKFMTHLYTTLNPDEGGEVAENLGKLYTYVICQIHAAQSIKDLKMIDDCSTILKNLREGWASLKQEVEVAPINDSGNSPKKEAVSGSINASG